MRQVRSTLIMDQTTAKRMGKGVGPPRARGSHSGPRNPDPGALGVVEEGALADPPLVDGDPTADIRLVADPRRNFLVIMKDGRIYQNTVQQANP